MRDEPRILRAEVGAPESECGFACSKGAGYVRQGNKSLTYNVCHCVLQAKTCQQEPPVEPSIAKQKRSGHVQTKLVGCQLVFLMPRAPFLVSWHACTPGHTYVGVEEAWTAQEWRGTQKRGALHTLTM